MREQDEEGHVFGCDPSTAEVPAGAAQQGVVGLLDLPPGLLLDQASNLRSRRTMLRCR